MHPTFTLNEVAEAADNLRRAGLSDEAIGGGALLGALGLAGYAHMAPAHAAVWTRRAIHEYGLTAQHSLKALAALHAAGMEGEDATTSLDTLIRRLVERLAADVAELGGDVDAQRRSAAGIVGSDAVRAYSVLAGGAS